MTINYSSIIGFYIGDPQCCVTVQCTLEALGVKFCLMPHKDQSGQQYITYEELPQTAKLK